MSAPSVVPRVKLFVDAICKYCFTKLTNYDCTVAVVVMVVRKTVPRMIRYLIATSSQMGKQLSTIALQP